MRMLSVIWHRRNIRAETLINKMREVVPCAYGPHNRQRYGMVYVCKIDSEYREELIMVIWIEKHWKNTEEHVSWRKICLTSDKKKSACKEWNRIQMAYMTE